MGILHSVAEFLVRAKAQGISFERTLTLGRQNLLVSPIVLAKMLKRNGVWPAGLSDDEFYRSMFGSPYFADPLFKHLGALQLDSLDYSAYEGASVVHDMNRPIPDRLKEQYDVVLDGGTLEHVFNFPVAIKNCMEMVKAGGRFIAMTPAEGYFGHGFYQFSPELFYRVLSPENGFQIEQMIATADGDGISSLFGVEYPFPITGPWYQVDDPARVRTRVTLISGKPVLLYISAKKVGREQVFKAFPQQSDYVEQWKTAEMTNSIARRPSGRKVIGWLRSSLSESFCREVLPRVAWFLDPFRRLRHRRKNSFHNRAFYHRLRD